MSSPTHFLTTRKELALAHPHPPLVLLKLLPRPPIPLPNSTHDAHTPTFDFQLPTTSTAFTIEHAYVTCCSPHSIALQLPQLTEPIHARTTPNHRRTILLLLHRLTAIPTFDSTDPHKIPRFTKRVITYALEHDLRSCATTPCCPIHAMELSLPPTLVNAPPAMTLHASRLLHPAMNRRPIHLPQKLKLLPSTPRFHLPGPIATIPVPFTLTRTKSLPRLAPLATPDNTPAHPPEPPASPTRRSTRSKSNKPAPNPKASSHLKTSSGSVRGTARSTIPGSRKNDLTHSTPSMPPPPARKKTPSPHKVDPRRDSVQSRSSSRSHSHSKRDLINPATSTTPSEVIAPHSSIRCPSPNPSITRSLSPSTSATSAAPVTNIDDFDDASVITCQLVLIRHMILTDLSASVMYDLLQHKVYTMPTNPRRPLRFSSLTAHFDYLAEHLQDSHEKTFSPERTTEFPVPSVCHLKGCLFSFLVKTPHRPNLFEPLPVLLRYYDRFQLALRHYAHTHDSKPILRIAKTADLTTIKLDTTIFESTYD